MELIYIHIKKYREFKDQGLVISDKFKVNFIEENKTITIQDNTKNIINFYGKHINNISAIVGKNATGKSSLLDLIGTKVWDRDRLIVTSNQATDRDSYMFIYYKGLNSDGEKEFLCEISNKEIYSEWIGSTKEELDKRGINCKDWLIVDCKVNHKNELVIKEKNENSISKFAIVSVNNIFSKYKGFTIKESEALEQSVMRCYSRFDDVLWSEQFKFLNEQLSLKDNELFLEKSYEVDVKYQNVDLKNIEYEIEDKECIDDMKKYATEVISKFGTNMESVLIQQNEFNRMTKDSGSVKFISFMQIVKENEDFIKNFTKSEAYVLNYLRSYLINTINFSFSKKINKNDKISDKNIEKINDLMLNYHRVKGTRYIDYVSYYISLIVITLDGIADDTGYWNKMLSLFVQTFEKVCQEGAVEYDDNIITFKLEGKTFPKELEEFFDVFVDEGVKRDREQSGSVNQGFLTVDIKYLSDGQKENLKFYSSMNTQINKIETDNIDIKDIILLLDEVEMHMHPELNRRLVTDLITLLKQYTKLNFQIILASHSPFVISDICSENVITIIKENSDDIVVKQITDKTFGQNIHTLLKSGFFMNLSIGEFAHRNIKFVIELLSPTDNNQYNSKDIVMQGMNKKFNCCISDTGAIDEFIEKLGEPVIKKYILNLYAEWKEQVLSREEKITYYQNEIKKLKNGKSI